MTKSLTTQLSCESRSWLICASEDTIFRRLFGSRSLWISESDKTSSTLWCRQTKLSIHYLISFSPIKLGKHSHNLLLPPFFFFLIWSGAFRKLQRHVMSSFYDFVRSVMKDDVMSSDDVNVFFSCLKEVQKQMAQLDHRANQSPTQGLLLFRYLRAVCKADSNQIIAHSTSTPTRKTLNLQTLPSRLCRDLTARS